MTISIETLDACETSLKAALLREDALKAHNFQLQKERDEWKDRYKNIVSEIAAKRTDNITNIA